MSWVKEITVTGIEASTEAGRMAADVFAAALEEVRADRLIAAGVKREGSVLEIGRERLDRTSFEHIYLVGAGKASAGMAAAVEELLGDALAGGVVVTKYQHAVTTRRVQVVEAGHPIPDENSLTAGWRIHAVAGLAGPRDLVIVVLSGGASALMELPIEGVTLEDLRSTTDLLLRAGAPIEELNSVRACLSLLKAGGLARAAAPARVVCLVISDVLGNTLEVIGSGPCVQQAANPGAALDVLDRRGLIERVPRAVTDALRAAPPLQEAAHGEVSHHVLGDLDGALSAARRAALELGLQASIVDRRVQGEARVVGRRLATQALRARPGECLIAGGETTVTVLGNGKGGRSQELALAAAEVLAGSSGVALLAAGTDGTDGPTDAAGALVDGGTMAAGGGPEELHTALAENASYDFLQRAGALIFTGPTQTNVNDLVIAVRLP